MSRYVVATALALSLILVGLLFIVLNKDGEPHNRRGSDLVFTLGRLEERLDQLEEKMDRLPGTAAAVPASADAMGGAVPAVSGNDGDGSASKAPQGEQATAMAARLEELMYRVRTLEEDPINRGYSYLGSENPELRFQGLQQLRRLARFDPAAREAIRDMLGDPSNKVRREAIDALGDMRDKEALPAIMGMLTDADESIRRESVQALGKIGSDESGAAITDMLADASQRVREEAADWLGKMHYRDASQQLIKILNDKDEEVRGEAIASLGEIGAKEAAPILREIYDSNPGRHTMRLVHSLKNLGDPEPYKQEVAKYSKTALDNENPRSRSQAIRMLSWMARKDSQEIFKKALEDPSSYVRREAQRALDSRR